MKIWRLIPNIIFLYMVFFLRGRVEGCFPKTDNVSLHLKKRVACFVFCVSVAPETRNPKHKTR